MSTRNVCRRIGTPVKEKAILQTSKLLILIPIIDQQGITHVGRRIDQVKLPCENRHPCIIAPVKPPTNYLVEKSISRKTSTYRHAFCVVTHQATFLDNPRQRSSQEDR